MFDKLLSVQETAHILGCSRSHVYRLLSDNELSYVQLGLTRARKISPESIRELMRKKTVPARENLLAADD